MHFWLNHTAQVLCEQKGWDRGKWDRIGGRGGGATGGGGWSHPQGDMHMVAARPAVKVPWLGFTVLSEPINVSLIKV